MEREYYLKIVRKIFAKYPQKHQYLLQDLHDYQDGIYDLPKTKELQEILREVRNEENNNN